MILTEEKNVHMTHVEDLLFNDGVDGARRAILFLLDLRDMLSGSAKSSISATVKWDGCVHRDTVISTNLGEMTIQKIYESQEVWDRILIKGYDFESNEVVMTPLFCAIAEEGEKNWVEVLTEEGVLILTEDHEVHTANRGWVKAGELTENDDITAEL